MSKQRSHGAFFMAFVLLLFVLAQPVSQAQANAGPELEGANEIGSSISPYKFKKTNVQMVDEQIRLKQEIVVEGGNTLSQLNVQIDFHMRNTGGSAESMEAVFPLTDLRCNVQAGPAMGTIRELEVDDETFAVSIDGQPQTFSSLTTSTLIPSKQIDYYSGRVKRVPSPEALTETIVTDDTEPWIYDVNGNWIYNCKTWWEKFSITFPPHKDVRIRVSYVMRPYQGFTLYPWDTFTYIIITGRPWYGPIGQMDVSLQLPYPVTREMWTQLPYGYKISGDTISWQWKNVEPTQNLHFAVLSPDGWKTLQARRQQVLVHPEDAAAWEELANYYYRLARGPEYAAFYCSVPTMDGECFSRVVDWQYAHLAEDAYRQAIRLRPEEKKWHRAFGKLLTSMSLSANGGLIRLDYPSTQSALRELQLSGPVSDYSKADWLTIFKDMNGRQLPLY